MGGKVRLWCSPAALLGDLNWLMASLVGSHIMLVEVIY